MAKIIGRKQEVEELLRLFDRPENQLVTVCGNLYKCLHNSGHSCWMNQKKAPEATAPELDNIWKALDSLPRLCIKD